MHIELLAIIRCPKTEWLRGPLRDWALKSLNDSSADSKNLRIKR